MKTYAVSWKEYREVECYVEIEAVSEKEAIQLAKNGQGDTEENETGVLSSSTPYKATVVDSSDED